MWIFVQCWCGSEKVALEIRDRVFFGGVIEGDFRLVWRYSRNLWKLWNLWHSFYL